jgi:hypothetical protein
MKKLTGLSINGRPEITAYPSGCGDIDIDFFSGDEDHTSATVNMNYNYHSDDIEIDCIDIHTHNDKEGNDLPFEDIDFEDAIIDLIADHNIMNDYYDAVNQAASDEQ